MHIGVLPRHLGRHLRQYDRLHRAARGGLPDSDVRHLHGVDGAAGRQGHAMGTGRRRHRVPCHQGGDLDLPAGLAVGRAWPAHHRYRGLLPGGDRRVAGAGAAWMVRHSNRCRPGRRG